MKTRNKLLHSEIYKSKPKVIDCLVSVQLPYNVLNNNNEISRFEACHSCDHVRDQYKQETEQSSFSCVSWLILFNQRNIDFNDI